MAADGLPASVRLLLLQVKEAKAQRLISAACSGSSPGSTNWLAVSLAVGGRTDIFTPPSMMQLGGMWPPLSRCGAVETTNKRTSNNVQLK